MTTVPHTGCIHYSELPASGAGSLLAKEWDCYRREVGRLIAEGHDGDWVLIHGDSIVGVWLDQAGAEDERARRFEGHCGFVKQIAEWEPVVRGGGYLQRCAG